MKPQLNIIGDLLLVPHIGAQYNMDRLVSADMRHCVQEGLTVCPKTKDGRKYLR